MCYVKWAGKSLVRPLAKNLTDKLPADWEEELDAFCEINQDTSGSECGSDEVGINVLSRGGQWGDDVDY